MLHFSSSTISAIAVVRSFFECGNPGPTCVSLRSGSVVPLPSKAPHSKYITSSSSYLHSPHRIPHAPISHVMLLCHVAELSCLKLIGWKLGLCEIESPQCSVVRMDACVMGVCGGRRPSLEGHSVTVDTAFHLAVNTVGSDTHSIPGIPACSRLLCLVSCLEEVGCELHKLLGVLSTCIVEEHSGLLSVFTCPGTV